MNMVADLETVARRRIERYLPKDFGAQLEIQRHAIQSATILGNRTSYPLQSSLVDVLEHGLDALGDRLMNSSAVPLQVDFLAAKLRLCAIPLFSVCHSEQNEMRTLSRAMWYKGFHAASQIANIFSASTKNNENIPMDESGGEVDTLTTFFPKHYFRVFVMAGMYLLKIIAVDDHMSSQDKVLARNRVREVYEGLIAWSRKERDEFARAARVIELLSTYLG